VEVKRIIAFSLRLDQDKVQGEQEIKEMGEMER
jgi:hypothetical protein